jgi:hypothetical protein
MTTMPARQADSGDAGTRGRRPELQLRRAAAEAGVSQRRGLRGGDIPALGLGRSYH